MKTIGLTDKQLKKIKQIAKANDLRLVILFGSRAGGAIHKESDIDIGVLPDKNLTFEQEINLSAEFFNVSNKIDLTNLRKAPPLLMKKAIDNCIVLYEKHPTDFSIFEIRALNYYKEAQPLFMMHFEAVKNFVKI